ncbi:hypothetical protein RSOLAG1IB_01851 [Rhizoctonia solani AG-1 IB]|uniref:Uncharacterized protein n=1 Tax=Thanatephorus cucumeris (strain AG1-IB / isolate 7/3/14) TaxID=1108050 RepID=A0A0B7FFZ1_THACB|nr:hypothetical protein RSOLAG1IB_01851 [Rhizoctonia solani AG-1 IB]
MSFINKIWIKYRHSNSDAIEGEGAWCWWSGDVSTGVMSRDGCAGGLVPLTCTLPGFYRRSFAGAGRPPSPALQAHYFTALLAALGLNRPCRAALLARVLFRNSP